MDQNRSQTPGQTGIFLFPEFLFLFSVYNSGPHPDRSTARPVSADSARSRPGPALTAVREPYLVSRNLCPRHGSHLSTLAGLWAGFARPPPPPSSSPAAPRGGLLLPGVAHDAGRPRAPIPLHLDAAPSKFVPPCPFGLLEPFAACPLVPTSPPRPTLP